MTHFLEGSLLLSDVPIFRVLDIPEKFLFMNKVDQLKLKISKKFLFIIHHVIGWLNAKRMTYIPMWMN